MLKKVLTEMIRYLFTLGRGGRRGERVHKSTLFQNAGSVSILGSGIVYTSSLID